MLLRWTVIPMAAMCLGALRPSAADACSCMPRQAPCEATFQAAAVFVGRVTALARRQTNMRDRDGRLVHFDVTEAFRGVTSRQASISTGTSVSECGYPFEVGKTYVVFATRWSDEAPLSTGICDRTRPVAEAASDLIYLRGLASARPTHARISGNLVRPESMGAPDAAMPAVIVTVRDAQREWRAASDGTGAFELAVDPGRYGVDIEAPAGFYATVYPDQIDLPDVRACMTLSAKLAYDGRLSGRVVDSGGLPLEGFAVQAMRRNDSGRWDDLARAASGPDGRYELTRLPPGRYVVGFGLERLWRVDRQPDPALYHPGVTDLARAALLEVGRGTTVDAGAIRWPPEVGRSTVRGVVREPDGTPASGVTLSVTSIDVLTWTGSIAAAADGSFVLTFPAGGTYTIEAARWSGSPGAERQHAARATVAARAGLVEVTLRLEEVRGRP